MTQKAFLVLEDGTKFEGILHGDATTMGEVVFNTSMTGYQEVVTDPSYCQQIITMTYPLIGNYGVYKDDHEASQVYCSGLIVKELNGEQLKNLMLKNQKPILEGVDTRALVRTLREKGVMKGAIIKDETSINLDTLDILATQRFDKSVEMVSVKEKKFYKVDKADYTVVLYDFGYKENILQSLLNRNCHVHVVPYNTSFEDLGEINPDGVVYSNGPGDPCEHESLLPDIYKAQQNYPFLGICMGHQLFALCHGAQTQKMHFGHRGANHAVRDLELNRSYLSSQNHGYEVKRESLNPAVLMVTHENVNDSSVEGLKSLQSNAFSVQFHPEANPGPRDTAYIFDKFIENMSKKNRNNL